MLAYRAFLLLKSIDDGSGFVKKDVAKKVLTTYFGKNITYSYLSKMEETAPYLSFYDTGVRIHSWKKVWSHFDIYVNGSEWVFIPNESLQSKISFMAHIYAGFVTDKIISRDKIQEITGLARPTQRRYEEIAGVEKRYNFLHLSEEEYINNEHIPSDDNTGEVKGVFPYHKGGYLRQLPNTFGSCDSIFTAQKKIKGRRSNMAQEEQRNGVLFVQDRHYSKSKRLKLYRDNNLTSMAEKKRTGDTAIWETLPYGYSW
jgi:hypothetical protein